VFGGLGLAAFFAGRAPSFAALAVAFCAAIAAGGATTRLLWPPKRPAAPVVDWGEPGLIAVTRDLLRGRIAGGMLHDLAQPLNVIAMASSNLSIMIDQVALDADDRQQLSERAGRIAKHADGAADILGLMRGLGRGTTGFAPEPGSDDGGDTVRDALGRAIAVTRSSIKHAVRVELSGDALDLPAPGQPGALEVLAVAAMLSAFGAFSDAERGMLKGTVRLRAVLEAERLVVEIRCVDVADAPLPCRSLDPAMCWLLGEVAREEGGSFRCVPADGVPVRLTLSRVPGG